MAQRPNSSSSSFFGELRTRELNGFKVRQMPYLGDLSIDSGDFIIEHENNPSPPLAISFCKTGGKSYILAVSDEEGFVSCYDTRKRLRCHSSCWDKTAEAKVSEWVAHENAIFDICWIKVLMRKLLRGLDVELQEVQDGEMAVDYFEKGNTCDLIFMDKDMPIMDGYEAKFWRQSVEAYMVVNNEEATKQIFSRCLLNCLQISLCFIFNEIP